MRKNPTSKIEQYRVTSGPMASKHKSGRSGAFLVPMRGSQLCIIASDGSDWDDAGLPKPAWEHVSVSLTNRCPTWEEMDFVKRIFWRDDETVLQLHVPRANHIDYHEFCLHMWKPIGVEIPLPPSMTVAPVEDAA